MADKEQGNKGWNWLKKTGDGKMSNGMLVLLVVVLVGVFICLFQLPGKSGGTSGQESSGVIDELASRTVHNEDTSYEKELENRLKEILGKIEGAGKVEVMITTKSTNEKILAEDIVANTATSDEKDSAGGSRVTTQDDLQTKVVLEKGTTPYVVKENAAVIEGVLVVAEGGDIAEVKSGIINSVSALMNVPVHKVTVLKMEAK